ncbi:MAG: lipopolysaccharide heptosyltransferase II [Verrucomicrobia bacterium]|nr:lipopolysaccharide heptosyltransferase II [Verrucomicrobiota bacterium]
MADPARRGPFVIRHSSFVIIRMTPPRILIRGVNWLGDAVMTTPALLRLREKFPDAHVTLLTPEKLADLWLHHPAVDSVLMFAPEESVWKIGRELRAQAFDLALVLPNSPRSALEVWWGRVPRRVGYAAKWRRFFLTQTVPPRAGAVKMHKRSVGEIRKLVRGGETQNPKPETRNPAAHHLHQYLHLASALGANPAPLAPRLDVAEPEVERLRQKFGLDPQRTWLGLNAGAEYGPAKRWPIERFIAAAKEIQRRANCGWILFGGGNDTALTAQIESALRPPPSALRNLTGQTSLRELCAALKLCRVLLTNDTGPMHVAAAVGTPVVVPFGSTSPELTGPGLPGEARHFLLKSDAPCAPCFLRECPIDFRCMNGLGVERVVAAVLQAARL